MGSLVRPILLTPMFQSYEDLACGSLLYGAVDSVHDAVDRSLPHQRVLRSLHRTAAPVDQLLEVRADLGAVYSRSMVLLVHLLPFDPVVVGAERSIVFLGP